MTKINKVKKVKWCVELGISAAGFITGIVMYIIGCVKPDLFPELSECKWVILIWTMCTYLFGFCSTMMFIPEEYEDKMEYILYRYPFTFVIGTIIAFLFIALWVGTLVVCVIFLSVSIGELNLPYMIFFGLWTFALLSILVKGL